MDFRLQEAYFAFKSFKDRKKIVLKRRRVEGGGGAGHDIEIWLVTNIARISKVLLLFQAI
jgi:hypothetical protein